MGHQIAGTATSYPVDFTVPDDGDAENATSVNVAFGALADRTANAKAMIAHRYDTMPSASGTWTCPLEVTHVWLRGWGAGGGGGCGGDGSTGANTCSVGGAGGGAAIECWVRVAVTPGLVYTYIKGTSAAGSASSAAFGRGASGGDTTFSSPTPTVLATFRGAQGGGNGAPGVASLTASGQSIGGGPCKITHTDPGQTPGVATQVIANYSPGFRCMTSAGGDGFTKNLCGTGTNEGQPGGASPQGFDGGAAGLAGASNAATRIGGGAGGGGGAGPGGTGGAGGTGGSGETTTAGAATAGSAAAVGTGAGGGGGGGGGGAGTTPSVGQPGAASGSGSLFVIYSGPQAVFT